MQEVRPGGRFARSVWVGAGVVIVLAGVKLSAELIVPFLLAAFVALLCSTPLFWLNRKGVPNALSVLLVVLGLLALVTVLGSTAGSSVNAFTRALPEYRESLQGHLNALFAQLERFGLDTATYRESIAAMIDPGAAMGMAAETLMKTGGALANSFMLLLTVVFILMEAVGFPEKLRQVVSNPEKTFDGVRSFVQSVQHYLVIKTVVSVITGVLAAVCTGLIGVDFPVLWGLIAFAFNFVPTIGSFIAAIPPVLLGVVQFGPGALLTVGGCYAAINVVMGNIVEPRITGQGLGLSPLVVFLSLVFWGWLLGPVGMLLSVPLTMIVKIACESNPSSRAVGVLLGPSIPEKAKAKAGASKKEKEAS